MVEQWKSQNTCAIFIQTKQCFVFWGGEKSPFLLFHDTCKATFNDLRNFSLDYFTTSVNGKINKRAKKIYINFADR